MTEQAKTSHEGVSPRVSALIPLYNKRAYIARAIDSALAQTYPHFELIVVDDGSTDGSSEIVRAYNDPRLRVIRQENAGEGAARNRGIAEARADWIALLDADDEWLPRFLERTMAAVEANPAVGVVFTNVIDGGPRTLWIDEHRPGGLLPDFLRFYADNDGRGMTPCSTVLRKQAVFNAGGFPLGVRHGGDVDTWTRLAMTGISAYYVAEPLAIYHSEAAGSVMKDGVRKVLDAPWVTIRTCQRWQQEGRIPPEIQESVLRMVQCMYIRYVRLLILAGDNAAARKFLRSHGVPKLCGRRRYLWTYLRTITPRPLVGIRQWLKNSLRRLTKRGREE